MLTGVVGWRDGVRYQFIPQLLFLNCLFGYLSFLIVLKWCQGSKPDLYHVMIYMFLSPREDLGDNQLFMGQTFVQVRMPVGCVGGGGRGLVRVEWWHGLHRERVGCRDRDSAEAIVSLDERIAVVGCDRC